MAITRLGLYNIALAAIGERSLDSLSEDVEPRRYLDEIFTRGNGAVRYCLEQGHWNFALRAVALDASSNVEPAFGFSFAFERPSDFVRLNMISGDENFSDPLGRFEPEGNYIQADIDPIYLRYISDDASFGGDFSLWPESFSLWVGHYLATQLAPRIKNDIDMERLEKRTHRLLIDARSKDASHEPVRYPPLGSWSRARHGGRIGRERGKRNTLIG